MSEAETRAAAAAAARPPPPARRSRAHRPRPRVVALEQGAVAVGRGGPRAEAPQEERRRLRVARARWKARMASRRLPRRRGANACRRPDQVSTRSGQGRRQGPGARLVRDVGEAAASHDETIRCSRAGARTRLPRRLDGDDMPLFGRPPEPKRESRAPWYDGSSPSACRRRRAARRRPSTFSSSCKRPSSLPISASPPPPGADDDVLARRRRRLLAPPRRPARRHVVGQQRQARVLLGELGGGREVELGGMPRCWAGERQARDGEDGDDEDPTMPAWCPGPGLGHVSERCRSRLCRAFVFRASPRGPFLVTRALLPVVLPSLRSGANLGWTDLSTGRTNGNGWRGTCRTPNSTARPAGTCFSDCVAKAPNWRASRAALWSGQWAARSAADGGQR